MTFDKISPLIIGLSLVCILLTFVAIGAQAGEMPPQPQPITNEPAANHADPVHDLISRQLDAIRLRDADRAWSYTTEEFHKKHDTPREFLGYLRLKLRPVYNHEGFTFGERFDTERGIIQRVEIDEHNGEPVTVIYRLEEQEGGAFLIDSFAVLALDSDPI